LQTERRRGPNELPDAAVRESTVCKSAVRDCALQFAVSDTVQCAMSDTV